MTNQNTVGTYRSNFAWPSCNMHYSSWILKCKSCGKVHNNSLTCTCDNCGDLVDPFYFRSPTFVGKGMARMRSLLPIDEDEYVELLTTVPTTSIVEFEYKEALFFLKDETTLPTGTTKDRMAVCVVAHFLSNGVRDFVVSSTGNSSTAIAYYVGKLGGRLRCHVFGASKLLHRLRCRNKYVTAHTVEGDFVVTSKVAKIYANQSGFHWEGGFFNYARREGLKTAYLEAFEQLNWDVDVIIQTVSSGMGILGGYKGLRELHRFGIMNKRPCFICVQQDTCMPMTKAFYSGRSIMSEEFIEKDPVGLAEAVLRGDPTKSYPYISRMVLETGGKFVAVSQRALAKERNELWNLGIRACYASAASFAAAKHLRESGFIRPNDRVLVMITGGHHETDKKAT